MFSGVCVGNLVRDVELQYAASGTAVAKFSLASRRNRNETDFFEFTAFDKAAELIAEYCKKGSRLSVACKAQLDKWEDKEGNKRSKVCFIVTDFELGGGKKETPTESNNKDESAEDKPAVPF
jgi:single-strand DNA-binding protein